MNSFFLNHSRCYLTCWVFPEFYFLAATVVFCIPWFWYSFSPSCTLFISLCTVSRHTSPAFRWYQQNLGHVDFVYFHPITDLSLFSLKPHLFSVQNDFVFRFEISLSRIFSLSTDAVSHAMVLLHFLFLFHIFDVQFLAFKWTSWSRLILHLNQ